MEPAALIEVLAEHEMDWRIDFDTRKFVNFCSCGASGYDYDDEHRVDVILASLRDEPTLLSLLGLRQVGWHPDQAPFNRFGLTRHRIFENDLPVYVKEAP